MEDYEENTPLICFNFFISSTVSEMRKENHHAYQQYTLKWDDRRK